MTPGIESDVGRAARSASPGEGSARRSARPWWRETAPWLLLLVLAAEFLLFDQFGSRRHTRVYPRWHDQVHYLTEGYTAYERARASGFIVALDTTITNPSGGGTLHDTLALIAFLVAGPSRSAALAVNMLALIGWQLALFLAVARIAGSRPLAFCAAMLPLALAGPWLNVPGSAYDFRLEHLAMCGVGISSALALLTNDLRSRRGAIAFGIAVGATILVRFLTAGYFVLIFAGLLASVLCGADRKQRGGNLARAAFVAFVIAAPLLWLNRTWSFEFHRLIHYGLATDGTSGGPGFVFRTFARQHLGWAFAAIALLGSIGFALVRGGRTTDARRFGWLIGLLFFAVPATLLAFHRQASDVLLGVLAPGTIVLVVMGWWSLARTGAAGRTATAIATVLACASLGVFAYRQRQPAYDAAALAHIRQVNTIADRVFAGSREGRLARPVVAADYVSDCFDAGALRVLCYERQRTWMPFETSLPTGTAEPEEADVMARLARSDFVFLSDNDAPAGPYAFDRKLAALRPRVRQWCEANLVARERVQLLDRRMTLYQRPTIPFAPARP